MLKGQMLLLASDLPEDNPELATSISSSSSGVDKKGDSRFRDRLKKVLQVWVFEGLIVLCSPFV